MMVTKPDEPKTHGGGVVYERPLAIEREFLEM